MLDRENFDKEMTILKKN